MMKPMFVAPFCFLLSVFGQEVFLPTETETALGNHGALESVESTEHFDGTLLDVSPSNAEDVEASANIRDLQEWHGGRCLVSFGSSCRALSGEGHNSRPNDCPSRCQFMGLYRIPNAEWRRLLGGLGCCCCPSF